MSSNAANELRRCRVCGAELRPGDAVCWLCQEKVTSSEGAARSPLLSPHRRRLLGVGLLLAVLALVEIGLAQEFPGVALLMLVLAVPVILHVLQGSGERGLATPVSSILGNFLMMLAMIIIMGL